MENQSVNLSSHMTHMEAIKTSNCILVCHAFSGSHHTAGKFEMMKRMVGGMSS